MIIGYARVSTNDQSLDVQREAIKQYAKELGEDYDIYEEKESGGKTNRAQLKNAIRAAQDGNKFVVYKLDRLARSTKQLYETTETLTKKGVEFVSLSDNMDTTTSTGRAMFGMLAVFAEFERDIIRERTKAGLESAKRQGRTGGRPSLDKDTRDRIVRYYNRGDSATEIAKVLGVGRSTIYKIVNEAKLSAEV